METILTLSVAILLVTLIGWVIDGVRRVLLVLAATACLAVAALFWVACIAFEVAAWLASNTRCASRS